jgi:hypothetical protein
VSRVRALARVVRDRRWREIRDVALAEAALLRAQLVVWTRPTGRLLDRSSTTSHQQPSEESGNAISERLALAITRATRFGIFNPQCLVRAVALNRMLEAHGINDSIIRIGVRWGGAEGEFVAHAWVERHGVILGDTASNTSSFVPLTDVQLSTGRTGSTR